MDLYLEIKILLTVSSALFSALIFVVIMAINAFLKLRDTVNQLNTRIAVNEVEIMNLKKAVF